MLQFWPVLGCLEPRRGSATRLFVGSCSLGECWSRWQGADVPSGPWQSAKCWRAELHPHAAASLRGRRPTGLCVSVPPTRVTPAGGLAGASHTCAIRYKVGVTYSWRPTQPGCREGSPYCRPCAAPAGLFPCMECSWGFRLSGRTATSPAPGSRDLRRCLPFRRGGRVAWACPGGHAHSVSLYSAFSGLASSKLGLPVGA